MSLSHPGKIGVGSLMSCCVYPNFLLVEFPGEARAAAIAMSNRLRSRLLNFDDLTKPAAARGIAIIRIAHICDRVRRAWIRTSEAGSGTSRRCLEGCAFARVRGLAHERSFGPFSTAAILNRNPLRTNSDAKRVAGDDRFVVRRFNDTEVLADRLCGKLQSLRGTRVTEPTSPAPINNRPVTGN